MPLSPYGRDKTLQRPRRRTFGRGNTIAEYALVGVGILVASIGTLELLGGRLDQLVAQMENMMKHQSQIASTATSQQLAAKGSFTAAQSSQTQTGGAPAAGGPAAATGSVQAATQQGPVTQTVGANGTTESYASSITSGAQQALAAGTISQSEYNVIVQLANKGHDIATIQGLLEGAYQQSNGNSGAYGSTMLNFNGQNYTPSQLNGILQSNISQFSNLKTQASAQPGVMTDTKLLTTVNDSGANIINNGYSTQQQNQSSASFIQYQQTDPGGGSASTNQNSATICTTGQHLDANNHCTN